MQLALALVQFASNAPNYNLNVAPGINFDAPEAYPYLKGIQ